jgi:tRNA threonylcarbamoyladenosine biosynthesis protein TsaE
MSSPATPDEVPDETAEARAVLPTADDTTALGRALGTRLDAGDLVVLAGPLGAGKTRLAAGIGDGLGVEGPVTSPTFVIAREHPPCPDGRGVPLVHVDAYRLAAGGDSPAAQRAALDDLDLDTDLTRAAVVIEWGEGVAEHLAAQHLLVRLDRDGPDEVRTAVLTGPARLVAAAGDVHPRSGPP